MIDQLIQFDKELFLFLNGLGSTTWDSFWMFYTTKVNWIPLYAVLLFLMYKKLTTRTFVLTILVVVLMISFTDQVTNLFKNGIQRLRPCHNDEFDGIMRLVKSYCGAQYSYFSGHASNSMAVAVFSGLILKSNHKYLVFILLFWAALMGYSRIYIGVHYPLDIVSGMIFGGISGYAFYRLEKYLQSRFMRKEKPLL